MWYLQLLKGYSCLFTLCKTASVWMPLNPDLKTKDNIRLFAKAFKKSLLDR